MSLMRIIWYSSFFFHSEKFIAMKWISNLKIFQPIETIYHSTRWISYNIEIVASHASESSSIHICSIISFFVSRFTSRIFYSCFSKSENRLLLFYLNNFNLQYKITLKNNNCRKLEITNNLLLFWINIYIFIYI